MAGQSFIGGMGITVAGSGGGGGVTLAGDVTGPSSSNTVVSLTGTSGVVTATATAIAFGAAPPTTGDFLRIEQSTAMITTNNAAHNMTFNVLKGASNNFTIGDVNMSGITIVTGNSWEVDSNGAPMFGCNSSQLFCYAPIKGDGSTSPYSVHGVFTQAMADSNQVISAANSANHIFVLTGTNTAARTVTISCSPKAGGWKLINNQCLAFAVNVQFSSGSSVQVPIGKNAVVWADGTNAQLITMTQ